MEKEVFKIPSHNTVFQLFGDELLVKPWTNKPTPSLGYVKRWLSMTYCFKHAQACTIVYETKCLTMVCLYRNAQAQTFAYLPYKVVTLACLYRHVQAPILAYLTKCLATLSLYRHTQATPLMCLKKVRYIQWPQSPPEHHRWMDSNCMPDSLYRFL